MISAELRDPPISELAKAVVCMTGRKIFFSEPRKIPRLAQRLVAPFRITQPPPETQSQDIRDAHKTSQEYFLLE